MNWIKKCQFKKKRIKNGLTVFIVFLMAQGCIFDRSDMNLSHKGFVWGLIGNESTLDILYYDQGIFKEVVVGIIDMDSILIVKAVSFNKFNSLESRNFPDSEAFFYILNYESYSRYPLQMDSQAISGPFSYVDLVSARKDLNLDKKKFKYW